MKHDIEKGKSQSRSSPEIPHPGTEQLRVQEDPFEGIPAVSLERKRQAKQTQSN